jgi:hypothetical protein
MKVGSTAEPWRWGVQQSHGSEEYSRVMEVRRVHQGYGYKRKSGWR